MKTKIRNIVWLFPFVFEKINIQKDNGQIPAHLSKLGYNVEILTYLTDSNKDFREVDGAKLVKLRGAKFHHLYSIDFPLIYYVLKNIKKIDCILTLFTVNSVFASVIFKLLKKDGIFIVKMDSNGKLYRGNLTIKTIKRLFGELIFRILSFTADLLIIESPEAKKRVLNMHPFLKNKLIMLSNGINQDEFDKLRKSVKTHKENKILFVGRVEYGKGVDLLIKAFSKIKDTYPDWNLELVGEIMPSFKDEIDKLITPELRNRIALTGLLYDKELIKRYMQAEIFCFPSRGFHSLGPESFGLVLLEAMYFNNAIVSSNTGAAEYVLDYGNAGLIFESENLEELTRNLEKLMKNKKLRKKIASNAKLRCKKLFNWEKIIEELDYNIKRLNAG